MRRTITQTLSISYNVLKKNRDWIVIVFMALLQFGTVLALWGKSVDAQTAIQFLSDTAKISATLLAIFSSAIIFLLGQRGSDIRQTMSKNEFAAGFALLTAVILLTFVNMLTIDRNTTLHFDALSDYILLLLPMHLMIGAIFIIAIFIWNLYMKKVAE